MRRVVILLALVALFLGGCAAQVHKRTESLRHDDGPPRIVLMPLDLELSEMSAGGVQQPMAEWTELAQKHVFAAFETEAKTRGLVLLRHAPERADEADRQAMIDLVKLHRAVGGAILVHQYQPGFQLPTKGGRMDWSLGPEVATIARTQQADYALFFFMRDSYASAGRVAVIVVGALLGVGIPGGAQVGFASLVDLRNGDVVWFNRFVRGSGDLRTAEGARETIRLLLEEAPK